jgi:predicted dehydrogenase
MIRWGLVGTGAIAQKRVGPALIQANHSQLAAVCDVVESSARDFGASFQVPAVYTSLEELLANPEIDAVYVVSVYHTWYDPAPSAPGSWRAQKAQAGGGVLWDMGSHRFDLLVGLFGMPDQLWATTDTQVHGYGVEDTAVVYLKLGNGAHCVSTWQWNSRTWVDHLSIIGTRSKIVLEPMDSPNFTLYIGQERSQERQDEAIPLPENVHLPMIQDFIDAIRQGKEPLETGEEGLKITRILAAIEEAASTGSVVTL